MMKYDIRVEKTTNNKDNFKVLTVGFCLTILLFLNGDWVERLFLVDSKVELSKSITEEENQ